MALPLSGVWNSVSTFFSDFSPSQLLFHKPFSKDHAKVFDEPLWHTHTNTQLYWWWLHCEGRTANGRARVPRKKVNQSDRKTGFTFKKPRFFAEYISSQFRNVVQPFMSFLGCVWQGAQRCTYRWACVQLSCIFQTPHIKSLKSKCCHIFRSSLLLSIFTFYLSSHVTIRYWWRLCLCCRHWFRHNIQRLLLCIQQWYHGRLSRHYGVVSV